MLLPRILAPVRAAAKTPLTPSPRVLDVLRQANSATAHAPSPSLSFVRHATHQAQGRANGAKDGPGKRLGAKKAGGEYVIPGNIIFRQRGTAWFPGENCKFGRDHCIFATESGYVRYYRDPSLHPDRQYIGVALDKDDKLPYPQNAARKRRLGFVAIRQELSANEKEGQTVVADLRVADDGKGSASVQPTRDGRTLTMGKGYAYRQANWDIGRAAERANVQVKQFVPGDRWTAWRKSQARKKLNVERKKLRTAGKKSAKPKARKRGP
ncbi:ribosomal protein L27 [Bimuria novae-zelandiae CBS 107.79]|uniref:Large ribosomal subunit protein bL27m n=1 Tax=Bimuria novae-zelandiae CBS 107.79 TaxID=1447943 RepID=A0A6A5UV34_9PLEO|nr:ribosomal protein L27 [Bimuria novae-zelandiae CBS 107.79]